MNSSQHIEAELLEDTYGRDHEERKPQKLRTCTTLGNFHSGEDPAP
jgi:hypothetical protein